MKGLIISSICVFLLFVSFGKLLAQRDSSIHIFYSPNFGTQVSNFNAEETDISMNLSNLRPSDVYSEWFNFGVIFQQKWGVAFKLRGNYQRSYFDRTEYVNNQLREQYPNHFFRVQEYGEDDGVLGGYSNIFIGIFYQYSYKKWEFIPSFYIGATELHFNDFQADIKERNAHTIIQYRLYRLQNDNGETFETYTTFSPTLKVNYRISKLFAFSSELQFTTFRLTYEYNEIFDNRLTGEIRSSKIKFNDRINSFQVGLGISINLTQLVKLIP